MSLCTSCGNVGKFPMCVLVDGREVTDCNEYESNALVPHGTKKGERSLREGDPKWVNFGEVVRSQLGMQCQYACRYTGAVKGDGTIDPEYWKEIDGTPCCGEGLRFQGSTKDYHGMRIHVADVEEFVARLKAERN